MAGFNVINWPFPGTCEKRDGQKHSHTQTTTNMATYRLAQVIISKRTRKNVAVQGQAGLLQGISPGKPPRKIPRSSHTECKKSVSDRIKML